MSIDARTGAAAAATNERVSERATDNRVRCLPGKHEYKRAISPGNIFEMTLLSAAESFPAYEAGKGGR